ncbi:hypothetical protein [Micromonospora chersina]|uniref:PH domain-containing protein n=1 Tax=Micromonospora chersina TaxID=47854 RepID=A0A1C6V7H5_9ACTN|nr:hypothetical protein [Micromonospora chersina]SCL62097.1 hypothetical protein GA0070603_3337 [Micromonospora chersina]
MRSGPDELWSRRLLALLAGTAVAVATARGLLALDASDLTQFRGQVWMVTAVHLAQQHWRPRRTGRLRWRSRVVGRHGTEPGLVARRSTAGWLRLTADLALGSVVTLGVASLLPDRWRWVEVGRPVLLAAVALGLGWAVYREVRFTGRLALTASGIRDGGEWYPWSEIREARPNSRKREDGVWLRLDPGRLLPQVVGGRDVTVSDERLLAAIERFRAAPEALAVGLPVTPPEPASSSDGRLPA